jgi:hypothetical protein
LWRSSGLLADVVLFLIGLGLRALTKPVAPSPPAQSA